MGKVSAKGRGKMARGGERGKESEDESEWREERDVSKTYCCTSEFSGNKPRSLVRERMDCLRISIATSLQCSFIRSSSCNNTVRATSAYNNKAEILQ